jgi:mannose-6-phosphate isomerase-like protein (cupin superfamily)
MQHTKTTRDVIGLDWARRGFSCEAWVDPPNQVWHDFVHDVDELVLLLEGDCQIEMLGRTLRLHDGDELLIPAGTRHTVRNCGARPARWLHGYRASCAQGTGVASLA